MAEVYEVVVSGAGLIGRTTSLQQGRYWAATCRARLVNVAGLLCEILRGSGSSGARPDLQLSPLPTTTTGW